ncbi:hypothetical protein COCON_G00138390 [Conger conger]|uniref:ZP domain-containing protein n=1 Tax=Conger conger TaxID=82655 RepID=A0A9Q1DF84_CONCO|nr:zona pellucida sperm-binding protein 3-like [Conger conger]KAJ8268667.1 hypothetical protein COCON_G00138390 [Conger conger]
MIPVQFSVVLLVVVGYAVVYAEISVECGWNYTVRVKWTERQRGTAPYLLLGHCIGEAATPSDGKGGAMETVFNVQLEDCSFRRTVTGHPKTGGQIIYSNELSHFDGAKLAPTLYPVTCVFPRPQDWGPSLYHPSWQILGTGTLLFSMELMNGDFSGPAQSSTFYLGSLIPIWAAVDQQDHLPLLLLMDECVATTTPEPDPSGPVYPIISNGGCLMDSKFSSSRFHPRAKSSALDLQLQAFKFALGANIYIHCKLSIWDPQSLNEGKKACDYNQEQGRWELLDDPSQSSLCSCCSSRCANRKRRGVRSGLHGLTHSAVLGPLVIQDLQEATSKV